MKTKVGDKIRMCFDGNKHGFNACVSPTIREVTAVNPDGTIDAESGMGSNMQRIRSWVRCADLKKP